MHQEQPQLPLCYRMNLARARAQVNIMRDQRDHMRTLRNRLAETLSVSRLLKYWYNTTHKNGASLELSRHRMNQTASAPVSGEFGLEKALHK